MKKDYLNFILTIIAVCLIYIAFLKPMPQRYILKDSEKEMGSEGYIKSTISTISIFDTATGKEYILTSTKNFYLKENREDRNDSFIIIDFINRKIIHKNPEQYLKIIGYQDKKGNLQ